MKLDLNGTAVLALAGVAAVVVAALYVAKKGVAGAAAGAVGAAADAASGAVVGIGKAVGIPETSQSECQKAIAEGRTWDASFACPAGTFLGSLWDRATGKGTSGPPVDETILDRWDYYSRGGQRAGSGSGSVDLYPGP